MWLHINGEKEIQLLVGSQKVKIIRSLPKNLTWLIFIMQDLQEFADEVGTGADLVQFILSKDLDLRNVHKIHTEVTNKEQK